MGLREGGGRKKAASDPIFGEGIFQLGSALMVW